MPKKWLKETLALCKNKDTRNESHLIAKMRKQMIEDIEEALKTKESKNVRNKRKAAKSNEV